MSTVDRLYVVKISGLVGLDILRGAMVTLILVVTSS